MMFLPTPNLFPTIHAMIKNSNRLRLAVSYWGEGAIQILGLDKIGHKDVKILCSLESGACNPTEIKKLWEELGLPPENIRTMRELHAKVYLSSTEMIVASANASANGLGDEGEQANINIEAGYITSNDNDVKVALIWFDKIWNEGAVITDKKLDEAALKWGLRHKTLGRGRLYREMTFDEVILKNPKCFSDVNALIWVYDNPGLDSEQKRYRKNISRQSKQDLDVYGLDRIDAKRGIKYVFDFNTTETGISSEYGLYKIISDIPPIRFKNGEWSLPHIKVKEIDGVKFDKKDMQKLYEWLKLKKFKGTADAEIPFDEYVAYRVKKLQLS